MTEPSNQLGHEGLVIRNVRPIGFGPGVSPALVDVDIGPDGLVRTSGAALDVSAGTLLDGGGSYLSPGWTDMHVHIWSGGTRYSLLPSECGLARGVTCLVDAGSAGSANFDGFRGYVIEPADEQIFAFLNIGTIGLIAGNAVPEISNYRLIDLERTAEIARKHPDAIVGIKVRASGVIGQGWDLTPLKLAVKMGRVLDLPVMVHVGEPPPLYEEILDHLRPGDIVTHCFNGKLGGSLAEDPVLFDRAVRARERGIIFDIGHGAGSFSFETCEFALNRGFAPDVISTDLHRVALGKIVFDLATTMSKLLSSGMGFDDVVSAASTRPREVIRRPHKAGLRVGDAADFTVFDLAEERLHVVDSHGVIRVLERVFRPRYAVLGTKTVEASSHGAAEVT